MIVKLLTAITNTGMAAVTPETLVKAHEISIEIAMGLAKNGQVKYNSATLLGLCLAARVVAEEMEAGITEKELGARHGKN